MRSLTHLIPVAFLGSCVLFSLPSASLAQNPLGPQPTNCPDPIPDVINARQMVTCLKQMTLQIRALKRELDQRRQFAASNNESGKVPNRTDAAVCANGRYMIGISPVRNDLNIVCAQGAWIGPEQGATGAATP